MIVLVAAPMALLFGYGVLNLVAPRTTVGWQVRATARTGGQFGGQAFQRRFGIDPATSPSGAALRRVRLLGLAEIAVSVGIVVSLSHVL